jgi:hypothetical protein
MMTRKEFFASLREGRCTSVGTYPKYWILGDGDVISYSEARRGAARIGRAITRQEKWAPSRVEVNWENPDLYCDWSGERIESAYAEERAGAL